jgi:hypothetical protein
MYGIEEHEVEMSLTTGISLGQDIDEDYTLLAIENSKDSSKSIDVVVNKNA